MRFCGLLFYHWMQVHSESSVITGRVWLANCEICNHNGTAQQWHGCRGHMPSCGQWGSSRHCCHRETWIRITGKVDSRWRLCVRDAQWWRFNWAVSSIRKGRWQADQCKVLVSLFTKMFVWDLILLTLIIYNFSLLYFVVSCVSKCNIRLGVRVAKSRFRRIFSSITKRGRWTEQFKVW